MGNLTLDSGSFRPILQLALPVLAEETLTLLIGYTDWWLVGHYLGEPEHKAAMGLMGYVLWLLPSLFAAVAIGATALIARSVGARDWVVARRIARQALIIGGALAVVVTGLAFFAGGAFIRLMQLEGVSAELATRYLFLVTPAIPFIMVEQVGAACLRGAGDTVSGFLAKSVVNVVNITLSALLVIGPGPWPQWGWDGVAIGTAVGHAVGGTLLLVLLLRGRAGMHVRDRRVRLDPSTCRRLLRVGLPGGLDVLAILACHLAYLAIINSLGTIPAAAHGLGVQIEAMAYLSGAAFQVAATTLAGQFLGAGDPKGATQAVMTTCALGCSLMSAAALAFYFAGGTLASFFSGQTHDPTTQLTAELLKIVAISSPPLGVIQILTGALRGAGDTRVPLVISFVGFLGVRLPGACLLAWEEVTIPGTSWTLPGAGWSVQGAWIAMVLDTMLRASLVTARFWQGGWRRIKV